MASFCTCASRTRLPVLRKRILTCTIVRPWPQLPPRIIECDGGARSFIAEERGRGWRGCSNIQRFEVYCQWTISA